jgi:hypothetical protein
VPTEAAVRRDREEAWRDKILTRTARDLDRRASAAHPTLQHELSHRAALIRSRIR